MFDYSLDFQYTAFRQRPELYRIGKGEQGVLPVEPHKGEPDLICCPNPRHQRTTGWWYNYREEQASIRLACGGTHG